MLKSGKQLDDALAYQSHVGVERITGHFDDSAKSSTGPICRPGVRLTTLPVGILRRNGVGSMRVKVDSETGEFVGFFASPEE